MKPILVAAACVFVIACSHLPSGTDYVPPGPLANIHLVSGDAWSGGEVSIRSGSFVGLLVLPSVQAGGAARTVRRVDDSTIAAQLPDTNASLTMHVASDSFLPWDATVAVHGYLQVRTGPHITGRVQAIPGGRLVLATGDSGLVEFDVVANAITRRWGDTIHSTDCASTIGLSVRAGQYVLAGKSSSGSCGSSGAAVWQYGTTLTRTAAVPCTAGGVYDVIAEIGPGGAICGGPKSLATLQVSQCSNGTCPTKKSFFSQPHEVTGVAVDPSGRRAVIIGTNPFLVNAITGDSLGLLPFTQSASLRVSDVAWSAGGDTAYVLADTFGPSGGSELIMMNAATGARLASAVLPSAVVGFTAGVAVDPTRPWVYVATKLGYTTPKLAVFDARTLAPLAILKPPPSASSSASFSDDSRIVFNRAGAPTIAYVVGTAQSVGFRGFAAPVVSFELPAH